ncbi:hypothetical protein KEM55_003277 [Ascosphaera atra]|nr:hypothetical protein KEM55_003277 [Ascosphaera atra]
MGSVEIGEIGTLAPCSMPKRDVKVTQRPLTNHAPPLKAHEKVPSPKQISKQTRPQHRNGKSRDKSSSTRPEFRMPRPNRRNTALILPDVVDRLDGAAAVWGLWHHEGPYDCAYRERNQRRGHRPVDALKTSNAETLRSTPPEHIWRCIVDRRPLEGCAQYAPGSIDYDGVLYQYEEFEMQALDRQNYGLQMMKKSDEKADAFTVDAAPDAGEKTEEELTWLWTYLRQCRNKKKEEKRARKKAQAFELTSRKSEASSHDERSLRESWQEISQKCLGEKAKSRLRGAIKGLVCRKDRNAAVD